MDWKKFGFVASSKYRCDVVLSLENNHKMPKEITQETGMYMSHVSSTLKQLSENNIVRCINPKMRKGKIYALTEAGREICEELKRRK